MERDDIIRLAREAADPDAVDPLCGSDWGDLITLDLDEMVRFAALVAAHEREACARVCDKRAADYQMGFEEKYEAQACAYDIRARGEA